MKFKPSRSPVVLIPMLHRVLQNKRAVKTEEKKEDELGDLVTLDTVGFEDDVGTNVRIVYQWTFVKQTES